MPRKKSKRSPLLTLLALGLVAAYLVFSGELDLRSDAPAPPVEAPVEAPAPTATAPGLRLVTWNLLNLGRSKDARELDFIADVLRGYDLVAVQEVSTGPAGAQAVALLADALDRRGADWDYTISDPTSGSGSERYAFLWKTARLRLAGPAWLEATLADAIDREPFLARFEAGGRRLLVASFHAVPRDKKPQAEIARLDALHRRYADDALLVVGDFNLSQQDEAFDGLKALGYAPALVGQKTSLRMKPKESGLPDAHLANEYDNIFYEPAALHADSAGVVDFTGRFATLQEARAISDHLPVFLHLRWR